MDNFDELDEPVISSSGRKIKIKAETFSRNLAKVARYNGEGKAPCSACNHNHTVYDHNNNNVCQALRRIQRLNECFFLNSKT